MTHTLHRNGRLDDLKKDFVVFAMSAKTVNSEGSGEKLRRFFEICQKYSYINSGDMKTGNILNLDRDTIYEGIRDTSIVHYVFTDQKIVYKILDELQNEELGLSIVVSGLVKNIDRFCNKVGLKMHTVEFSGGIHGKIELLPEIPILKIVTMCGHGMVANNLVREMVKKIRKEKITIKDAALRLAKPCECGIFNPKRAELLLEKLL
jgi:hypothetical protein